jgi:exosortase E/protease (VPEID-CTERM system)
LPNLQADTSLLILSTDRFAVLVSEECSGLEGMGLMITFCCAWLVYFRRDYIFPRALLLIPVGLVTIYTLNIVRIAALMLIGHNGFPGVAVYGFHSQAGWIAFNAAACGLVFVSRRNAWLNRQTVRSTATVETENPTAVYVMPLLAVLIAGTVSHALASDFERFYPLRMLAGVAVLIYHRKKLLTIDWQWSWRGPVVGLLIFVLWIVTARYVLPPAAVPSKLAVMSAAPRYLWIACRTTTAVLIVPLVEELAYRGFLMRRLISKDFESVAYRSVSWLALCVAAIAFGLPHGGMWLPATAAGIAYGLLLMRRERLGEAVVAHATSNLLIASYVLGWNQWQLW